MEPAPTSTDKQDDVVRIKLYRNELYGHTPEPAISHADFNRHWNDIATVLVRLGGQQQDIDELRVAPMDPTNQQSYIQCLEEWEKNDKTVFERLEELKETIRELGGTLSASSSNSQGN